MKLNDLAVVRNWSWKGYVPVIALARQSLEHDDSNSWGEQYMKSLWQYYAVFVFVLPVAARANVIYTYEGHNFNSFTSTVSCDCSTRPTSSDFITVQLTFANVLMPNLIDSDVESKLSNWEISDGIHIATSTDPTDYTLDPFGFIDLWTDASGAISEWAIEVDPIPSFTDGYWYLNTTNDGDDEDFSITTVPVLGNVGTAEISNDPGTWTGPTNTVSTPEPGTWLLTGFAVVVLIVRGGSLRNTHRSKGL
jgi:hypothetical protein